MVLESLLMGEQAVAGDEEFITIIFSAILRCIFSFQFYYEYTICLTPIFLLITLMCR